MGRFDVLKGNNIPEKKENRRRQKRTQTSVGARTKEPPAGTSTKEPSAGTGKKEPPAGTSTKEPSAGTGKKEPPAGTSTSTTTESRWVLAMKKREQEEKCKNIINENHPKYWDGARWRGPMFIRGSYKGNYNKRVNRNVVNGKNYENNRSSFLFFHNKIEYSRNDNDWHDSWTNTFTQQQLEKLKQQEAREYHVNCCKVLEQYGNRLEKESNDYYNETGELDEFAKAQVQRMQYEKYAEQFEVVEQDDENSLSEDYMDDEEYLEDDYN